MEYIKRRSKNTIKNQYKIFNTDTPRTILILLVDCWKCMNHSLGAPAVVYSQMNSHLCFTSYEP